MAGNQTGIEEIRGPKLAGVEMFVVAPPLETKKLGTLGLFVDARPLPASLHYLAAVIIGAMKREYYAGNGKDVSKRFTRALRAANEALAHEASQGVDQWIGRLKAVAVATPEDALLFSGTGGCIALLKRGEAVTEIPLEAGEGSRPFGSVTIGQREEHDEVLAGAQEDFDTHTVEYRFARNAPQLLKTLRHTEAFAALRIFSAHADGARQILTYPRGASRALPLLKQWQQLLSSGVRALRRLFTRVPSPASLPTLSKLPPVNFPRLPAPVANRVKTLSPRTKRLSLAGLIIVLLTAGVASARIFFTPGDNTTSSQRIPATSGDIETVEKALREGEAYAIAGDTEQARTAFNRGLLLLERTEETEETRELRAELLKRRNALEGVTPGELELALSLQGLPLITPEFFSLSVVEEGIGAALGSRQETGLWVRKNISRQEADGSFFLAPSQLGSRVSDTLLIAAQNRLLLAGENGAAALDLETKRAAVAPLPEAAAGGTGFLSLNTPHVLFTVPEAHMVYSLVLREGDAALSPWLSRQDPSLAQTIDVAGQGGTLLALHQDNTFVRYADGRRIAVYRIEGQNWNGQAVRFAMLSDTTLAVLDTTKGRILITNLRGDIQTQITVPELVEAKDIATVPLAPDTVFVLFQDRITELPLSQED